MQAITSRPNIQPACLSVDESLPRVLILGQVASYLQAKTPSLLPFSADDAQKPPPSLLKLSEWTKIC